ncbi:Rapamycin-insensitive companion of mTOR, N-term-domain-containing protein [Zopfochytrium polystomum]|nr:Rapamycin-insensitive companion of mTOR, N-term-domain-containing protein [Zopfochytrium polystomum]
MDLQGAIVASLNEVHGNAGIPQARLSSMNNMLKLIRAVGFIDPDSQIFDAIVFSLRACLIDQAKEIRANAYRILRHLVVDKRAAEALMECDLDIFLARTLTRDHRHDLEREQALKLVRTIIEIPGAITYLPPAVVRVLVAVSEYNEDRFKNACIATLCEIAILDPQLLSISGGIKTLFTSLAEGPVELFQPHLHTINYLIDQESTRAFIRPSVDLESFTDIYSKGPTIDEKSTACSRAISLLLQTWTGAMYLSFNKHLSLKSIIDCLYLPHFETRKLVLDLLLDVFGIEMPKWFPDYLTTSDRTFKPRQMIDEYADPNFPRRQINRGSLSEFHLALRLIIFVDINIFEALAQTIHDSNKEISLKGAILVGQLLEMCRVYLPSSWNAKIQSLPLLFSAASDFGDEIKRHQSTVALLYIDSLDSIKENAISVAGEDLESIRAGRYFRRMEEVKSRIGLQTEDSQFRGLTTEAEKLLSTKEWSKWNWDLIAELLSALCVSPKRVDEVVKNTKILRRLLSFYRPLSRQFSEIKKTKFISRYTKLGCDLLRALLSTAEGIRLLCEHKMLAEIADCFEQLDPAVGTSGTDLTFSKTRLETLVVGEYFILLSELSRHSDGVKILERFKLINYCYRLTELRNREDIVKYLIAGMDYSRDSHERLILSKVLVSGSTSLRLFATGYMRSIFLRDIEDFADWGVDLLVTQLHDVSIEVSELAAEILEEIADEEEILDAIIGANPSFEIGTFSSHLLLRFLSRPAGLSYLQAFGYVEAEMKYWLDFGMLNYVTRAELSTLSTLTKHQASETDPLQRFSERSKRYTSIPLHFFGELSKSEEGAELLADTDCLHVFTEVISAWEQLQRVSSEIPKLKACVWAVGHIGASPHGVLLLDTSVIPTIVQMIEQTVILTLKGVCFYALGLLCQTKVGRDALHQLGWESTKQDSSHCICLPAKAEKILSVPQWQTSAKLLGQEIETPELPKLNTVEEEILKNVGNMSNHISANTAAKNLSRLRHEQPDAFQSPSLYFRVFNILSNFHFRLSARRFLNELFERAPLDDDFLAEVAELRQTL